MFSIKNHHKVSLHGESYFQYTGGVCPEYIGEEKELARHGLLTPARDVNQVERETR